MRKKRNFLAVLSLMVIIPILIPLKIQASLKSKKEMAMNGGPVGFAVDEAGGRLFVLNQRAASLAVVNEKDLRIIKTVPLNKKVNANIDTRSIAYSPDLNRIYLTTGANGILTVDGASYEIISEIKDEGKMFVSDIAVANGYLYLSDWERFVHRYTTEGKFETSIGIKSTGSLFMHLDPLIAGRLYVTSTPDKFFVIDGRAGKSIAMLSIPDIRSIPESYGDMVYVAGVGNLFVIDAKKLEVAKAIKMDVPGTSGFGMAVDPNTGNLFVVASGNTVTVFDTKKGKIVDRINVCSDPKSIVVNKVTGTVYVACPGSDRITVLNY